MRRHGTLDLVLVLPDGTRSLIPAAWTDLAPQPADGAPPTNTLAELLRAGQVLAALAGRLTADAADGIPPREEAAYDQRDEPDEPAGAPAPAEATGAPRAQVGRAARGAADRRRGDPGAADRPRSHARTSRGGTDDA
jgi:hypothetical protein